VIFVVQAAPPRDPRPLFFRLAGQRMAAHLEAASTLSIQTDELGVGALRTLVGALRRGWGEEPVTVLEDDVEVCADFVPYVLGRWRDPGTIVVQWYAPGDIPADSASGWLRRPGREYCWNQATTFSAEFIRKLIPPLAALPACIERKHGGDELIRAALVELGADYAVRVPGGAQHLGTHTLLARHRNKNPLRGTPLDGGRVSRLYVGRDGRMGDT
jgi:hypothetical protein